MKSISFIFLFLLAFQSFAEECKDGPHVFFYSRVVDGDTIDGTYSAKTTLGMYLHIKDRIRLSGVNTPEVHGSTKAAGLAAAGYTKYWLESCTGELRVCVHGRGNFGRILADVICGVDSLGEDLVDTGHAAPYRRR